VRLDDSKELAQFVAELSRETDRGLALVGAALIDEKLRDTLESFFCEGTSASKLLDGGYAPIGTFSARIQLCYSLGLIDEQEYREISLVRKVRNEFAHSKHGISFQTERIRGFCATFTSDLPDDADYDVSNSRFRFTNAVVCITLRLYYRPEWVAKERREPKTWVEPDAVRWRSFDEEKPPDGKPVMVIAKRKKD